MPRIKITLEADLSDEEAAMFPPDDVACATQNIYSIIRRGTVGAALEAKCEASCSLSSGKISKALYDALIEAYDIEISLGKKFDETIKVEFI